MPSALKQRMTYCRSNVGDPQLSPVVFFVRPRPVYLGRPISKQVNGHPSYIASIDALDGVVFDKPSRSRRMILSPVCFTQQGWMQIIENLHDNPCQNVPTPRGTLIQHFYAVLCKKNRFEQVYNLPHVATRVISEDDGQIEQVGDVGGGCCH